MKRPRLNPGQARKSKRPSRAGKRGPEQTYGDAGERMARKMSKKWGRRQGRA